MEEKWALHGRLRVFCPPERLPRRVREPHANLSDAPRTKGVGERFASLNWSVLREARCARWSRPLASKCVESEEREPRVERNSLLLCFDEGEATPWSFRLQNPACGQLGVPSGVSLVRVRIHSSRESMPIHDGESFELSSVLAPCRTTPVSYAFSRDADCSHVLVP